MRLAAVPPVAGGEATALHAVPAIGSVATLVAAPAD
jgi:hypothetical protein